MPHAKVYLKAIQTKTSHKFKLTTGPVNSKKVLNVISMKRGQVNSLTQISTPNSSCREIRRDRSSKRLTSAAVSSRTHLWVWTNKSQIPNTTVSFSISRAKDLAAPSRWTSSSQTSPCLFKISLTSPATQLKTCMEITWDRAATILKWVILTSRVRVVTFHSLRNQFG